MESYLLMEPDARPVSDGNGDSENMVYKEIVQMKQDHIISVFRCQIIETIVSQYCGHCSSGGYPDTLGSGNLKPWKHGNVD
jgi:hypothetical protein